MNESRSTLFRWPVRIYYEDTDCGGVVYHARYLAFLERARTELLRHAGFAQGRLAAERGLLFAVRRLQIDYLQPARYDDSLEVLTRVVRAGPASLDFRQTIERLPAQTGGRICAATVNVVCLSSEGLRPRRLPTDILEEILS